jgi:hypothetical protein
VLNRFAEAIQEARVDVVPRIMIGGQPGASGSVMEALCAQIRLDSQNRPEVGGLIEQA